MDLKKVLDQTVRELKREVNKKVLKVPEIEQKVLEATSNEPWGPHGTLMADIAQATRNFNEYQMIMGILWKRLNDTGKNWRHVYKALTVLEFLVANGAERIIDDFSEHAYQVQTLVDFQYIEPNGKDQGINVRKKAQTLVALVNDKEKIREVRHKAATNRDKYRGVSSTGSIHKPSSYSSTGGGYSGDQDDERVGSNSRYGGRDDDKYGAGRDRDTDRYREEDRFGRDVHHVKEDEHKNDRERHEDYSFGQKGGEHSHNKYAGDKHDGADKDQFFDDDDHVAYRTAGGRGKSDYSPDNRRAEVHFSKAQSGTPPSYEDTAFGHERPENSRDGGGTATLSQAGTSAQGTRSPTKTGSALSKTIRGSVFATNVEEELEDFDPRGSFSRPGASAPQSDENIFGQTGLLGDNLSSIGTFAKSVTGVEDLFSDSVFVTGSVGAPTSATPSSALQALPAPDAQTSNKYTGGDPFTAIHGISISPGVDIFPVSSQDMIGSAGGGKSVTVVGLQGPTVLPSNSEPSDYSGTKLFGGPGFNAQNSSTGAMKVPSAHGVAAASLPSGGKKSFEQKGLWADTLSTGLVDLNIEGPKSNPLAELGIELRSRSTFSERRKDDRSMSASMGKAMGSGSGLGLVAASNLAPPLGPLGMGSGTGIGVGGIVPGHNFGMGMGMGRGPQSAYGLVMPSGMDAGFAIGQGIGTGPIGGNGPGLPMAHGMRVGYGPGYANQQR